MPVLIACQGCERDRTAQWVAAELDRRGLGEAGVAGTQAEKARSRYPVHVIEGCAEACGKRWLAAEGVEPVASFILDPAGGVDSQVAQIAAALSL